MNAGVSEADARDVVLELPGAVLGGTLGVPAGAIGAVLFAHGSGSSRSSPRNRAVARVLRHAGLITLLFDLLTEAESRDRSRVFDIELLAQRLVDATSWARGEAAVAGHRIGCFGASTGAAAALLAAARAPTVVAAVVSRGGRPDLAMDALPDVTAPTLLLVGARDETVLALNRAARARMTAPCELVVVPGASHLFEEPGTLERVSELAAAWFTRHLVPAR